MEETVTGPIDSELPDFLGRVDLVLGDDKGIRLLDAKTSRSRWSQDKANQVIRDVASEHDVVLIDLIAHLRRSVPDFNEPMAIFYDGMHLTDRGSRVLADEIAGRLFREVLSASHEASGDARNGSISH